VGEPTPTESKRCKDCGETKPLSEYPVRADSPDGHRNQCCACQHDRAAQRYAANAETEKARSREWRQNNRGRRNAYNREYEPRFRAANLDKVRTKERERYWANPEKELARINRWRHGPAVVGWFAEAWDTQQGLCYLCEAPLTREDACIDHDHTCCPKHRSCSYCRRGIACPACNVLIGNAHDDPDILDKIARRFRPAARATRERIASKPHQMELGA
jgi:Recombination endonuclease VII